METHPIQSAQVGAAQGWSWLDSRTGNETIILLPGFMGEAETSFLYVLALETHFRVISLTYPPSIGQVQTLCDGLVALLDGLGLQQATFLGGSSSGFVAQALVRQHPARVNRLILTHTGLPNPQHARKASMYLGLLRLLPFGLIRWLMQVSMLAYFPRPSCSHVFWRAHFQEVIRRQTRAALSNRFALLQDFHSHYRFLPADLAGWPGKILLMEMSRDRLTTPHEQAAMRALYHQADLHVFPQTAHYAAVESPDEQIRVIKAHLMNT